MTQKLRLYLHIPFCIQKCLYCDFLSWRDSRENQARYIQALCREIRAFRGGYPFRVSSLFLGGGTPSVLNPKLLEKVMDALMGAFSFEREPEMTIEANPGTVNAEKLQVYKKAGFNRISFGLQSAHNGELKALGRVHTYEEFLESYRLAREAGFENINVDLMSGIPEQTSASWQGTLSRVLDLKPEHISAYSLIVEEGTPFAQKELKLPDEEEERCMYEMTGQILEKRGYRQYEISNYALPGRECRHNIGYWRREDYLGLGLGASSLVDNQRWSNTDSMERYLEYSGCPEKIQVCRETLPVREQMEETMFLGLRMMEGVRGENFQAAFGRSVEDVYGEALRKLEGLGMLQIDSGRICLTRRGVSLSNQVFVEFLQ